MLIKNKEHFEQVINNKSTLYKHIIDSTTPVIKLPEIFSVISVKKNKKMLKQIQEHFIEVEEFEYAAKIKNILENE